MSWPVARDTALLRTAWFMACTDTGLAGFLTMHRRVLMSTSSRCLASLGMVIRPVLETIALGIG